MPKDPLLGRDGAGRLDFSHGDRCPEGRNVQVGDSMQSLREKCEAFGRSWWAVIVISLLTGGVLYQRWHFTHPSRPSFLEVGTHVKPLTLQGLDSRSVRVEWKPDSKPTVLYAFSPSCVHCRRNVEGVRALAAALSSTHRFIGLSLTKDGLREFLDKENFQFPVYITSPTGKELGLQGTPETILLSPAGVVKRIWLGAYLKDTAADISKALGIELAPVVPVQSVE